MTTETIVKPQDTGLTARQINGRKGGLMVKAKYGDSYYSHIGHLGGRPRSPGLDTILRRQAALKAEEKKKEEALSNQRSLKALKELYQLRIKRGEIGGLKTALSLPGRSED